MVNVFRSFPGLLARLGIEPRALVHIGAHEGQEVLFYRHAGIKHITLVEPIPELADRLRRDHPDVRIIEAACDHASGRATLHIPRRTNMATLAAPQNADGPTRSIDVHVVTLAEIQQAVGPRPNIAVVDAQGRELDVLDGADLHTLDMVIVETCTVDDPTMASPYRTVAERMATAGYVEADRWVRDYDTVNRWARGDRARPAQRGEIRDVVFTQKEPAREH
jgi:FkbM family methyltransferase